MLWPLVWRLSLHGDHRGGPVAAGGRRPRGHLRDCRGTERGGPARSPTAHAFGVQEKLSTREAKSFPPEVAQKLKTYVYSLIDPRNGERLYVRKGKGNRGICLRPLASSQTKRRCRNPVPPPGAEAPPRLRSLFFVPKRLPENGT